jgi:hypothetical protein
MAIALAFAATEAATTKSAPRYAHIAFLRFVVFAYLSHGFAQGANERGGAFS